MNESNLMNFKWGRRAPLVGGRGLRHFEVGINQNPGQ